MTNKIFSALRNGLAALALATTALLALPGCSPQGGTGAPASKKPVNLYGWSEYVPQSALDAFTKETGITVNYETYASNEEMLSKVQSGGTAYDIVMPSEYAIERLVKQDLLLPLDHAKIPNLPNILPEYRDLPYDTGNKFSVPYMAGTVGIVTNTEKIPAPIKSFKDLFTEANKNRIVVLNDGRELVTAALSVQGVPINSITPSNLAKTKPLLSEWFKLIKLFDSDSPKTALQNGDVDAGLVWAGEAAILYNTDKKFQYFLPDEGGHLFIDSMCIPKKSQNPEGAHALINFLLRPEISIQISEAFPYTNPNGAARKLLTPEALANPASYPPTGPRQELFQDIGPAAADIDRLFTELKLSAGK